MSALAFSVTEPEGPPRARLLAPVVARPRGPCLRFTAGVRGHEGEGPGATLLGIARRKAIEKRRASAGEEIRRAAAAAGGPGVPSGGGRGEEPARTRDRQRGPLAWVRAREDARAASGAGQWRLLAHTVTDQTGLKQYIPAVKAFLDYAEEEIGRGAAFSGWSEVDAMLLAYLTRSCYLNDKHFQHGSLVVNGLACVFPEVARDLPLSWRALRG